MNRQDNTHRSGLSKGTARWGRRYAALAVAGAVALGGVTTATHTTGAASIAAASHARRTARATATPKMGRTMPGMVMSTPTPMPSGSGMTMGATKATTATPKMMTMYEGAMEMQMYPLSGKAPTWDELSRVYHMLDKARLATAKYRDVRVAERDGYSTAPVLFVAGQGYHYINPLLVGQPFDPATPPVLVYNKINGKMTLSGLMYLMPDASTYQQLASIFPASMAAWHRHINNCVTGGRILNGLKLVPIHDRATCVAHGGHFLKSTGWRVHAWIWQANGSGLFDMDM